MRIRYQHLLNRKFIHGQQDCYTLACDIYRDNLGLTLTNYARPDDWWLSGMDLYEENFRSEGFKTMDDIPLDKIQLLDAFLIAIPDQRDPKKTVTNHCAIYIGDGKVIHHPYQKLSTLAPYRGGLRHFTTRILRHKDMPEIKTVEKNLDILDYLLPHKRKMIEDANAAKKSEA